MLEVLCVVGDSAGGPFYVNMNILRCILLLSDVFVYIFSLPEPEYWHMWYLLLWTSVHCITIENIYKRVYLGHVKGPSQLNNIIIDSVGLSIDNIIIVNSFCIIMTKFVFAQAFYQFTVGPGQSVHCSWRWLSLRIFPCFIPFCWFSKQCSKALIIYTYAYVKTVSNKLTQIANFGRLLASTLALKSLGKWLLLCGSLSFSDKLK